VRFVVEPEHALFAASVRAALDGWEAPREPVLGSWWDDRDDALARRLAEAGWEELWADPGLLAPAVAGALELGRAVAPLSLVDEATLGAPLALGERARHALGRSPVAVPGPGLTLRLAPAEGGEREPTLDGTGTARGLGLAGGDAIEGGEQRLRAWGAVTLGYLAGLADAAAALALAHVGSREQFGAPLGALPVVRGRLADVALLRDGLMLAAWRSADPDGGWPGDALAWAGGACRQVAAQALQVHGGTGFALEGGVHRWFRRAKVCQVWVDAALAAVERGA
jgi:hypothetical protein